MLFNPLIIYSLEKSNKEYLRGCKTAYSMIDRLKKRFYQIWLCTLLNILEYKIINLKLINNDYIQYINELNNLFEQHKFESNKLKRIPFDEETKLLFAVNELDRIGINSPPIYSYKTFDDLIKELSKKHDFFEKAEILRSKTTVVNDSNVNNINKNKPNNNKNYNNSNKIRNEYYCHICKTKGHSTDHSLSILNIIMIKIVANAKSLN